MDKPFIKEIVRRFRDRKEGLAEWMLTSLDIVEKSLEDVVADEQPTIDAAEVIVRSYAKYERKYRKSGEKTSGSTSQ